MSPIQVLCAVLVPMIWGLQFVVVKVALAEFPPLFLLGLRFAAIAMLLLPFVGMPRKGELRPMLLISLFMGGLNFSLAFTGLAHGAASSAGVAIQLTTPFAVLFAWPLLGERLSLRMVMGMTTAFVGVALTIAGPSTGAILPTLLVAGSALSLAIGSVLVKRDGPFEPMKLLAWMSLFTVPQVLLMSAFVEHGQISSLHTATVHGWLALLYTIVLGGITAFGLWFWLIASCSMSRVAPYALLQTVFAVVSGILFLNEPLTTPLLAGMLTCIAGVAITQRAPTRSTIALNTPGR